MSTMIPFSGEAREHMEIFLSRIPFGKEVHGAIVPECFDPVPDVNSRGGRDLPPGGWRAVFSFVVTDDMCNPMYNLHGGAAATIIDSVTSAAMWMLTTDTFWGPPMVSGVSIGLDMQYLNAAPVGTKVRLTCTVEHMTGSLANIRGELTEWETGKRFATGVHVKTWRAKSAKSKL